MTRINLADVLADQSGSATFEVVTSVTLEELLSQHDFTDVDIDIDDLLADRQEIAIIWKIDDVKQQRPDLDDDQCWEVLKQCQHDHDANIGMTWHVIDCVADMLYVHAPKGTEAGHE